MSNKIFGAILVTAIFLILLAIFVPSIIGIFRSSDSVESDTKNYYDDPYSGVLIVNTDIGQGSCFVVAERDGWYYAVTAGHVLEWIIDVTVDEELYIAEIVRVDGEEDIAMIRFRSSEVYRVYSFAKAEVGSSCTAIGWSGESQLIYKGYVVSTNFRDHVATNCGALPGCSGGALINSAGDIIGMVVAAPMYNMSVFDSTVLSVPARFAEAMVITIQ